MCGIAALWDPSIEPEARRERAEAMSLRLAHRGPDGSGTWMAPASESPVTIVHRRLAIRGLGIQGAQPMEGAFSILSFNGELFGCEPLRAELIASGATFRGTSDTEILLHALETWPVPEALARVRGQFAFAWFDRRTRRLIVARDRLGIRPLYMARNGARFAAASEQKALLGLDWVDDTPSVEAMLRFAVTSRTDDVPGETMIRGISSLSAGHYAAWDGSELSVSRYFRVDAAPKASTSPELRSELDRAAEEQIVSDVPIGATVSGGLDSSTVALLTDRVLSRRNAATTLHLFAYHDHAAEADERPYQNAVLAAIKTPHVVHWVSSSPKELVTRFDRYVHHQEEPYGDVSSYAEYCLAEEARSAGVKVLLNGLGGDEVFVGYPTFIGPLLLDVIRAGQFAALKNLLQVTPAILARPGAWWYPLGGAAYHALPSSLRNAVMAWRSSDGLGLSGASRIAASRDAWSDWHRHDGRGHTNAALRGAIESWCIPRYLLHSDRMGLAHGVEGRVPLLDEGVIAAAFGIPPHQRVGATGLKASLRAAVADILPREVRERAWKVGFHAPLGVYVGALEEPLRAGISVTNAALGAGARWEALDTAGRWRLGVLGAYLSWTRSQRSFESSSRFPEGVVRRA